MCSKCEYGKYIDIIDDMLFDSDYEFADDTLTGIRNWIEEHEHITEGQIEAIENIRESF